MTRSRAMGVQPLYTVAVNNDHGGGSSDDDMLLGPGRGLRLR